MGVRLGVLGFGAGSDRSQKTAVHLGDNKSNVISAGLISRACADAVPQGSPANSRPRCLVAGPTR